MFSASDYGISEKESPAARRARNQILTTIQLGKDEQKRLVDYCARNIPRDRYVHPSLMEFGVLGTLDVNPDTAPVIISYARGESAKPWGAIEGKRLHKHALGQLCDIAGLPRIWLNVNNVDSEKGWRRDLLVHDLNTLFKNQTFVNRKKQPAKFLHRLVGDEVRAVLTQSYNRHLVSAAVLQPFLAVCDEIGLQPTRASITDMRVGLQTYLPFAFEPIPGEFIALGAWWGNSDFGQGRVRVSHTVMRVSGNAGGSMLTEDAFSRTHIGSIVEETDLILDEQTAVKELEAVASAIQSTVRALMEPAQVQKILDVIARAHEAKIEWAKLKAGLAKALSKSEVQNVEDMLVHSVEELPRAGIGADGQPLPSRWWAAAALSHLASKQVDPARELELKQVAGQFLESE